MGPWTKFFEMLTWNQLSIHDKKIFFLNIDGFYDHLISHIQHMEDGGFLYGKPHEKMTILNQASDLLRYL